MERTNFIEGFTRDMSGDLLISKNDGRTKIGKNQFEAITTSIKRPKKLASKRFNAKENAIEIQQKIAKRFEATKIQIEKHERNSVKNPPKFLSSKQRKLEREQKRMERNKKIGRL